ncbi:MAG: sulfite exporter TauE/SafE family protein [bacterium]|nr:sulfite exporter TauE/SafE family protein [bacterium]
MTSLMHVYLILTGVAFCAATVSAIIGMGGGILLLATMFCFMPHSDAIPTHAAVQLVSNSTRVLAYARSVDWRVCRRFIIGALPGSVMAIFLLLAIGRMEQSEPILKALIGVYILVAAFLPKRSGAASAGTWWDWPLMGLVAGSAALLVGAAGPLIAPLFARREFVKERLIATKAMCQMFLHLAKIPAFVYLRYTVSESDGLMLSPSSFADLGLIAVCMAVAVIPGTLLGKRLLRHVSERAFRRLFQVALTVAGLKTLLIDGIYVLLG